MSMMIPLFPKLMRNLGASHALAGLIGKCRNSNIHFCHNQCFLNAYTIGSLYGMLQVFSSPVMVSLFAINDSMMQVYQLSDLGQTE